MSWWARLISLYGGSAITYSLDQSNLLYLDGYIGYSIDAGNRSVAFQSQNITQVMITIGAGIAGLSSRLSTIPVLKGLNALI